jgi:hypothetical protein
MSFKDGSRAGRGGERLAPAGHPEEVPVVLPLAYPALEPNLANLARPIRRQKEPSLERPHSD